MREEAGLREEQSINGSGGHRAQHRGIGFTAVNGEGQRNTSFRPEDSGRQTVEREAREDQKPHVYNRAEPTAMDELRQQHNGTRDADRHDTAVQDRAGMGQTGYNVVSGLGGAVMSGAKNADANQTRQETAMGSYQRTEGTMKPAGGQHQSRNIDSPTSAKRKRAETESNPALASGEGSPKRRAVEIDRLVDAEPDRQTAVQAGLNRVVGHPEYAPREGPPPIRPETEAHLAESLQLHLNQLSPEDDSGSPLGATAPYEEGEGVSTYSPEHDNADGSQSGKQRKRNFSKRTKTGCHTCRTRKKKCDEAKPECMNCKRGNFQCAGYGPKPPGGLKMTSGMRVQVPLQAKQYEAGHPPPPLPPAHHYPAMDGPRYDQYGRYPPPIVTHPESRHRYSEPSPEDQRYPNSHEGYPRPAFYPEQPFRGPHQLPPVDFPQRPPMPSFVTEPHPPPADHWTSNLAMPSYRPHTGAPTTVSSHESVGTSVSQRRHGHSGMYNSGADQLSEKMKMVIGKPFLHYIDDELIHEREQCQKAVNRYNRGTLYDEAISPEEKSRFFNMIVDPSKRPGSHFHVRESSSSSGNSTMTGPGRIGHRTVVDAPFHCDYGYNLNIGNDVVIQSGCYMQDVCDITIGDRTIIGPNVKFYGLTASIDRTSRKGSQSMFYGGAIRVEEDCFIGGDVVIMPFKVIGRGAVVGAGSVVTKNVKPNTVVAGNPAREIRSLGEAEGPVQDRHMRPSIQSEQEEMQKEMLAKHGFRESGLRRI